MTTKNATMSLQLFYSYAHEDMQYKKEMEKALVLLRDNGFLHQWSDHEILPSQSISAALQEAMDRTDIAVFLLSNEFIQSPECKKEWFYFRTAELEGRTLYRIPIILRPCPWIDFLGNDDVKVLPQDGKPVIEFPVADKAWNQIYEGVKRVVLEMKQQVTPKEEFLHEISRTDFLSENHLKLQDLFVFPELACADSSNWGQESVPPSTTISSQSELLGTTYALVHGQENSGKSALARHMCLSLLEQTRPVLLVEQKHVRGIHAETFLRSFHDQYQGDYDLWIKQDGKTLIVDLVEAPPQTTDLLVKAMDTFDQIIVTLASDDFYTYFRNDERLADFRQMKIEPLNLVQQEHLVRKRLVFSHGGDVPDGLVDQVENRVNSIVVSNRILPRYPFYVLSILQTYEAFMPTNMAITSYGHCYLVLIIAHLKRSGISTRDDALNTCLNFASHLAYAIYRHRESTSEGLFPFDRFLEEYEDSYFIRESIIKKLKSPTYGLIDQKGIFRTKYMYFYFLGMHLAAHSKNEEKKQILDYMCRNSYREVSYLTLLFTIHHAHDNRVIDEILLRTLCTLDAYPPAQLHRTETQPFAEFVEQLPEDILSSESVESERQKEEKTDTIGIGTTTRMSHTVPSQKTKICMS